MAFPCPGCGSEIGGAPEGAEIAALLGLHPSCSACGHRLYELTAADYGMGSPSGCCVPPGTPEAGGVSPADIRRVEALARAASARGESLFGGGPP